MKTRNSILVALGLAIALGGAASAQPVAQDQVNARVAHQDARIHEARAEGTMSARKAHRLHMAERHIRRQERRIAYRHNGRLPLRAQAKLTREQNKISNRIG